MNQPATNAAEQLRDIHLPADVSWFPPAIGWWILLALIIALIVGLRTLYKRHKAKRAAAPINWRPLLQEELEQIQQQFESDQDKQQLAIDLSQLLRKTVVTEAPNKATQIAGLTGQAWLTALDEHFAVPFSLSASALTEAPYNPKVEFDADSLLALVKQALTTNTMEATNHA